MASFTPAWLTLNWQPRNTSQFVFPSSNDPAQSRSSEFSLWRDNRRKAGIEDARLHYLRVSQTSQAIMNGVPMPGVSCLLDQAGIRMALHYTHFEDQNIKAAV